MFRTTMRRTGVLAIATLLAVMTIGTASASPKNAAVDEGALARALAFETAVTHVAEAISPSVVSIQVEMRQPPNDAIPFFFGGGQGGGGIIRGGGSGIIVRSDGYILTNNHVVREATRIDVHLKNGKIFPASAGGLCLVGERARGPVRHCDRLTVWTRLHRDDGGLERKGPWLDRSE